MLQFWYLMATEKWEEEKHTETAARYVAAVIFPLKGQTMLLQKIHNKVYV